MFSQNYIKTYNFIMISVEFIYKEHTQTRRKTSQLFLHKHYTIYDTSASEYLERNLTNP